MPEVLLNDQGDLPRRPEITSGTEITVQRIGAALALFEGEWIPDEEAGLPWIEWFHQTPMPVEQIEASVRRTMSGVLGVQEVPDVTGILDRTTGVLRLEAEVIEDPGSEVNIEFTIEPSPHEFHPIFTVQQVVS